MKTIDIDSFVDICLLGSPRFSPDGRLAAFLARRPSRERNAYLSDVYLLDRESMSVSLLTNSGNVTDFFWSSPDTILYSAVPETGPYAALRRRDKEFVVYYEISAHGGEGREACCIPLPVKEFCRVGETGLMLKAFCRRDWMDFYRLSPQERQNSPLLEEDCCHVYDEYPFWQDGQEDTNGRRMGLWLYDQRDGSLRLLTPPDFDVSKWEYHGGRLVYSGAAYGREARPLSDGVYLMELDTGRTRCVMEPGTYAVDTLTMLYDKIFLTRHDCRRNWARESRSLFFADLDTLELRFIGPNDCHVGRLSAATDSQWVDGRLLHSTGEKVYFCTILEGEVRICSIDRAGQWQEELRTRGSCSGFAVKDGEILWCGQREGGLPELYLGQRQISHFNDGYRASHSICPLEPLRALSPDGTEVRGFMVRPADYQPGRRYPAVLHIHGGPCMAFLDIYYHDVQVWANHGYFVFFCDPRGSDGRGKAYADISGRYGTVDYEDVMAFLDRALAVCPEVDPGRLGVVGGSYGGFMTSWIVGHTDRFTCAVALRPVTNWVTLELLSDIGQHFVLREMGTCTAENPEELWRRSPMRYAYAVKTPTLFIHSDHDFCTHMVESVAMYTALRNAGTETELCVIKGESHGLSRGGRPRQRILRMERILTWLDAHLKDPEKLP